MIRLVKLTRLTVVVFSVIFGLIFDILLLQLHKTALTGQIYEYRGSLVNGLTMAS